MKKSIVFHLSLFLLVSMGCANQTSLAKTEPFCCIIKNPDVAKIFEVCQKNPEFAKSKLNKLGNNLKTRLLLACNLSEKLQLKKFTKYPTLFANFFTGLIFEVAEALKIGYNDMKLLAESLQIPLNNPVHTKLNDSEKTNINELSTQLLNTFGDNLKDAIIKIIQFLDPSLETKIKNKKIAKFLNKTLQVLSKSERQILKELAETAAFKKIATNLPVLMDNALSILKEC